MRFQYCLAAVLLCSEILLGAAVLSSNTGKYIFNEQNGALQSIEDARNGRKTVSVHNSYLVQRKSGDLQADEKNDSVTGKSTVGNSITYVCNNPDLPDFEIRKRYWIADGLLRRELTLLNRSSEKAYFFPFSESIFSPEFKEKAYYFGAGYLGPFKPAAVVDIPTPVNEYVQTSKGMVLINASNELGSYAHYRVKINDTIVYPWWQSAISRYREKEDRLYYMPNGWKMCLGGLDIEPNDGSIRLTDAFSFFHGSLYDFFTGVYGSDTEITSELAAIQPVPEVMADIVAMVTQGSNDSMRYLGEMLDEGIFLYNTGLMASWFDYRMDGTMVGWQGGEITADDLAHFFRSIRDMIPGRVMTSHYTVPIAATLPAPIFKERPEWFRVYDREGREDSLFPGMSKNFQAMLNKPQARKFFIDGVISQAEKLGNKAIYVDEAQQYNVINWQTGEMMRDDHTVELWRELRTRAREKNLIFTMNGSGQPFGDFSYMENWVLLSPPKWREYAGVALGLELFSMLRPGARISPLYWHILRENDYTNRLLALGWIPTLGYAADNYPLAPVRAAYEAGDANPIPLAFTPNWMEDPRTDIESYAIQRIGGKDTLLSFINRGPKQDIAIQLDLATLPHDHDARINIWRMPVWRFAQETPVHECKTGDRFFLSNREYRDNYQKYGWLGGFVGAPQLVYSGNAQGTFKDTARMIDENHMVQYIITAGPMAIYTVNNLGANYFFTHNRKVSIDGRKIMNEAEKLEIMLADLDYEFTDITVNGKADIPVKTIDIGGVAMQCITVGTGENTVSYRPIARRKNTDKAALQANYNPAKNQIEVSNADQGELYALTLRGATLYCGTAPIPVPPQHEGGIYQMRRIGDIETVNITLPDGELTEVAKLYNTVFHPEKRQIRTVHTEKDGVVVTKAASYVSSWEDAYELQRTQPVSIVEADEKSLFLRANTTPRERVSYVKHYTRNFAGFEMNGARQIRIRFRSNFGQVQSLSTGHITYNFKHPRQDFAGFVIDFQVNGEYAKRVALSAAIYNKSFACDTPPWGCAKNQDMHFDLGPLADKAEQTLSFDLTQIAPEGWNGTVFFSIGGNNLNANRKLEATILEFNNSSAGDFVKFSTAKHGTPDPLQMPRLLKKPDSLDKINHEEWKKGWARIEKLQKIQKTHNEITQQTQGYFAYDEHCLYIGAFAEETGRKMVAVDQPLWRNDCLEYYFIRPDGQMLQMVIDVRGKMSFHVRLQDAIPSDGITVRSQKIDGEGFYTFVAIPWKKLGINSIAAGTKLKFNLCRTRNGERQEFGSWGVVESAYAESDGFGTIILGRFGQGQGRYEEVMLDNK